MKIKKIYQGELPENKILNTESTSQTDTYSCDYINNLNVYSTEETRTGTWIDGKPLYRKVVTTRELINANSTIEVLHNIENIDTFWVDNANSFFKANSGLAYGLPMIGYQGSTTDKSYAYADKTKVYIFSNGSWSTGWLKVVTLLYTKTTD